MVRLRTPPFAETALVSKTSQYQPGAKTLSIEPGSPGENGSIESFNGKLRDELLARELCDTLLEAMAGQFAVGLGIRAGVLSRLADR